MNVPADKAALTPGDTNNKINPAKNWMWKKIIVKRVVFFKNLFTFPLNPNIVAKSAITNSATKSNSKYPNPLWALSKIL